MSIGNLIATLGLNSAPFKSGLKDARGELGTFSNGIGALARGGIARALGPAAVAIGAAFSVGSMVGEAREAAAAQNKLGAVLTATGGAAGLSAEQISGYAEELQALTNFEDDATVAAAGVLATFKEIKGQTFKDAIASAQDMSSVMGQDLNSSIVQVGKALNDPIKGVTALRRVGVSFTQQQLEQIAVMQKSGNLAGAQQVILRELQSEFGGAARRMADPITQARNAISNLGETIGGILLPPLNGFAIATAWVANGLNSLISGPVEEAPPRFESTADSAARVSEELDAVSESAAAAEDGLLKAVEGARELESRYLTATQQLGATLHQINEANKLTMTTDVAARAKKEAIDQATGIFSEIRKVKDEIALMNGELTETDILLRDIGRKGAATHAKEELHVLRALIEQKHVMEEQKKLQDAADEKRKKKSELGREIFESVRTPFEKFQSSVSQLANLRNEGFISENTFVRAARKAKDELSSATLKLDMKPAQIADQFSPALEGIARNSRESLSAIVARQRGNDLSLAQQTAANTAKSAQLQAEAVKYLQAVAGASAPVVFDIP